ncbi:hypothetical protein HYH02_013347 [Chlamydomonas schloesseri]|uniref:Uncharacterized protein n=1 Tax=Chlamydomonas schloesseri TaxID=2026947 RepID=A0A835SWS1_9CHLO|nr:hypothetical protein HYH02_013347 [Chlamydomonas schloesseri]|eukprot:KAG2431358.1 hypothetical protein HYH02_013347 [Chlamydomonas schloesseri]
MTEPMEASTSGGRADGRGAEEFRSVFFKTRVLSQAKGSAYVEFGTCKVMVGVFGPRQSEVKLGFTDTGRLNCEVRFTTFAAARLNKAELGALESSAASALQQALEAALQLDKFPKAVFDVSALVLEGAGWAGGDTGALVCGASLALADAGVEGLDLVPGCGVSKTAAGELLLDPSPEEAAAEEAGLVLAVLPQLNEVTLLSVRGRWADSELQAGLELALGGCAQLRAHMRDCLLAALAEPRAPA